MPDQQESVTIRRSCENPRFLLPRSCLFRFRGNCALIALAFLALNSFIASAQSEAGSAAVTGAVLDASGAAAPNAQVVITNKDTLVSRSVTTSNDGRYTISRLPAGRYFITVARDGFKTSRAEDILLNIGSYVTIDVILTIGQVAESITVKDSAPLIETGRSQTSATINEKAVRDLPINGRNFLDFTILAPGVTRDPKIGDLSFAGQRGSANSLLVDGMDANSAFWGQSVGRAGFRNPYSFSQDAVQEFQVNTNSYAPELGRASGGVINVLTKSGTNDFHGTAFWFFRDRAMNANNFFNNRAGIARQPYHFNQFGGNIGGPIFKNRLFFFYNYDGQRNTSPNPVFFPVAVPNDPLSQQAAAELSRYLVPYVTGLRNDIHTAKVDWVVSEKNTISVRYNLHRFLGQNFENPGSQSSEDHTGDSRIGTDSITAAHTWVLGANHVLDQRFSYLREDNPSSVNGQGPETIVRQNGVTMLSFGRANFLPRFVEQNKYALIQTLNWNVGRHAWKFGHDFKFERAQQLNTNLFFGQYTFDSLASFAARRPSAFSQALATQGTDGGNTFPNANEYAFFGQDSWRLTEALTINYGVRYDLFNYAGNGVRNPDPGLAAAGLSTGVMPTDSKNVAGRFGFAYRLDRDGRFLIRGGLGTFYGRLPGLVARTIQAQNGIQVKSFTLTGANMPAYPAILSDIPSTGGATPDIFVMQSDFETPRSHQWSLNLETALAKDYALTIGYLGVRGANLTRVRDINQFPYQPIEARYDDGTPVTVFRRPGASGPQRPNPALGRISLVESGADSIYHGGFIQLSKRYAQGFQIQTSYTFSKVIDTAPEATAFIPNSAAEDPKLVQDTLNPNADRGIGDANIRHRFVLSGVWEIDYARQMRSAWARAILGGWQVSSVVSLQSGRWFSDRSNVDLNNDGNRFTDRPPGAGRNTIEGPGFGAIDLRLSKRFRLWGEGSEFRLIGEAFNALNRVNFSAIQQVPFNYNATSRVFTTNPTYLAPTSAFDPRILQVAARLTF